MIKFTNYKEYRQLIEDDKIDSNPPCRWCVYYNSGINMLSYGCSFNSQYSDFSCFKIKDTLNEVFIKCKKQELENYNDYKAYNEQLKSNISLLKEIILILVGKQDYFESESIEQDL